MDVSRPRTRQRERTKQKAPLGAGSHAGRMGRERFTPTITREALFRMRKGLHLGRVVLAGLFHTIHSHEAEYA